MFIVFLGAVVTKKSPLNAVQMLWVNLIMDTFAALALATEPPPKSILQRQPYKKDNPIITPVMSRNVQGHAIYQIIVLLVILFAGPSFLIDAPYESQCVVYNDGNCDKKRLNPYYTKSEYYEPSIWEPFTDSDDGMVKGLHKLKKEFKFDKDLLYSWRCNLFTQDNFEYSDRISVMNLCFIENPHKQFTDPHLYSKWMSKLNEEE